MFVYSELPTRLTYFKSRCVLWLAIRFCHTLTYLYTKESCTRLFRAVTHLSRFVWKSALQSHRSIQIQSKVLRKRSYYLNSFIADFWVRPRIISSIPNCQHYSCTCLSRLPLFYLRLLVSAYAYLSPKPRNGCLYLKSYSSFRVVTFSQVVTSSVYNLGWCFGGPQLKQQK